MPEISAELLLLGEAVSDEAFRAEFISENVGPVSAGLQHYTDELLYHEVCLRPGLEPRLCNLATITALIAAGQTQVLPFYLRACSRSYCEAVIEAHALLEILMYHTYTPVSALLFASLTASRDRSRTGSQPGEAQGHRTGTGVRAADSRRILRRLARRNRCAGVVKQVFDTRAD